MGCIEVGQNTKRRTNYLFRSSKKITRCHVTFYSSPLNVDARNICSWMLATCSWMPILYNMLATCSWMFTTCSRDIYSIATYSWMFATYICSWMLIAHDMLVDTFLQHARGCLHCNMLMDARNMFLDARKCSWMPHTMLLNAYSQRALTWILATYMLVDACNMLYRVCIQYCIHILTQSMHTSLFISLI